MRAAAALIALLVAAATVPAPSAEAPAAAPKPPEQQTTVKGSALDLAGRWLVMGRIDLPNGKHTNVPAFWDVAAKDGQPVLTERLADLPAAQQQAVQKANEAGDAWTPAPADLAAVGEAWEQLPSSARPIASINTEIFGRDGFDADIQNEPRTKDAVWIVRQVENFDASGAPVIRQVNLYAALTPRDGGWTGNYTVVTVAVAPFPIPITLQGAFDVYRLESAGGGLWSRLLDFFRGCGRR